MRKEDINSALKQWRIKPHFPKFDEKGRPERREISFAVLAINDMLRLLVGGDASELYLRVGRQPVMYIRGRFHLVAPEILTPDDTEGFMKEISPPQYQQELWGSLSAEFVYAYSDLARFRVSAYKDSGNINLIVRLIPMAD